MRIRGYIGAVLILAVGHSGLTGIAVAQEPDLEALFQEGMQALGQNRLESAQEAFQAILSIEPSLHRARLELAVAYYRLLDYQRAEELARRVLGDPATPPQVRVTITAFLAQIEADRARFNRRHAWRASLALGAMHDSNVNVGPSSELITDAIRLQPGATARSNNALFVQPGISHTFNPALRIDAGERVASLLWQSRLSFYHREYHDEDDFNLAVATVSTGPALVVLEQWRAGMNLTLDHIRLGGDDLALFTTLQPHVTWQFDNGELALDAAYTHRRYDDDADSGREGDYVAVGGTLVRYLLDRRLSLQGGLHYLDFDADAARWGYDGPEFMLAAAWRGWGRGEVYARAVQRDLDYDAIYGAPPLNEARDERERRLVLGFSHRFAAGHLAGWQMTGEFIRVLNRSNIGLFEYDRSQASLTFRRNFELGG
ncbi:MAG TPA: tetratricopeptide repeat protein [Thiohalobacter sp.]|nr:tetratricopeptide repeat protein [Thiohalobacter sp.]